MAWKIRQPDGTEVRNFAPQAGRVVVVGAEPLLEAVLSTNRQAQLSAIRQGGGREAVEGTLGRKGRRRLDLLPEVMRMHAG